MNKTIALAILIISLILAFIILSPLIRAAQSTCPQDGGWTKIDSDDLSLYPVTGATQYCFKAGSDNSQGCTGGIFTSWPQPAGTCGLSHWSYFIPQITPTPEITPGDADVTPTVDIPSPSITNSPTVEPTRVQPTSVPPTGTPSSSSTSTTKDNTPGPQPQGTNQVTSQGTGNPQTAGIK